MIKKDLDNPLVFVSLSLIVITFLMFVYYYFINPIVKEKEKTEVSSFERMDLELLTVSYLKQNRNISLNKILKSEASNNRYAVAAQYYYYKNGVDSLNKYDEILEVSRRIFNDEYINFSNFEINIDEKECGKEKFSTLEGMIYQAECDQNENVYEIVETYAQGEEYIVEFYASEAQQVKNKFQNICENFEIPVSYVLKLTSFDNEIFYDESYSECCVADCSLKGIYPLRSEIINQIKSHEFIYKMIFKKRENSFVFSEIVLKK